MQVRVQCRRKESSRSLYHLLMNFLLRYGTVDYFPSALMLRQRTRSIKISYAQGTILYKYDKKTGMLTVTSLLMFVIVDTMPFDVVYLHVKLPSLCWTQWRH